MLEWWDEVCSQRGSAGLRPPKVSYFKALRGDCLLYFTGSIWPTAWRWTADGKRRTWLAPCSATVMGISCVTTETVLVLLADAGLSWHTVPFHHFHLDCLNVLPPRPRRALSSPLSPHTSHMSLSPGPPNRNACSHENPPDPPATPFRAGEDVRRVQSS